MAGKTLDWGADESEFLDVKVNDWEFYTELGEDTLAETMGSKVHPKMARLVDEIIQTCKSKGLPMKTRSDFVRMALNRFLKEMQQWLEVNDEELTQYLVHMEETMKQARRSALVNNVRTQTQQLTAGLGMLIKPPHVELEEVSKRLTGFLTNVSGLQGDQDFLMNIFIRELFANKGFQEVITTLKTAGKANMVIKEFEARYEQLTSQGLPQVSG